MSAQLRERALALYSPPFHFEGGYIWDSKGEVVADDGHLNEAASVERIRGWGRIGYLPDPKALQDTVGELIAEALNAFWSNAYREVRP